MGLQIDHLIFYPTAKPSAGQGDFPAPADPSRPTPGPPAARLIGATYHPGLVNDIEIFYEKSLLALHPNVRFNFYRPGIGTCETEMH